MSSTNFSGNFSGNHTLFDSKIVTNPNANPILYFLYIAIAFVCVVITVSMYSFIVSICVRIWYKRGDYISWGSVARLRIPT